MEESSDSLQLSFHDALPDSPITSTPGTKILYKLVKVSADGSIHAVDSEEEVRAVEAVLRDHGGYSSDEVSEMDAERLPKDRRSLLILSQVYDTWISKITSRQRELTSGGTGQLATPMGAAKREDTTETAEDDRRNHHLRGKRGTRGGSAGMERTTAVRRDVGVGHEARLKGWGEGPGGPQSKEEVAREGRRSGSSRAAKRQRRPNLRYKEPPSSVDEFGNLQEERWEEEATGGESGWSLGSIGDVKPEKDFSGSLRDEAETGHVYEQEERKEGKEGEVETVSGHGGASLFSAHATHLDAIDGGEAAIDGLNRSGVPSDSREADTNHVTASKAWNVREVMILVEGVARCGWGKWTEIKQLAFSSPQRTSRDLQEKWRALVVASQGHPNAEKRQAKRDIIPPSVWARIKEFSRGDMDEDVGKHVDEGET